MSAAAVRREGYLQALRYAGEQDFWIRTGAAPGRGERLTWDLPADPFLRLAGAAVLRDRLDSFVAAGVTGLRARGATWDEVGLALGVSGEAVRQRFGKEIGDGSGEAS